MRPPTVRRSRVAPSFGQGAPGSRCDVRSPVCEPPRRPRMRSVSRIARCSRRVSSASRVLAVRVGSIPARHSASSHSRLPSPAIARLVHEHRLDRRLALRAHRAELGERQRERVGAEAVLVGIELDRAEAPRIAQVHAPAVGERQAEAVPRALRTVARVEQRIAGGLAVDQHATAHAQVQAEHAEPFTVSMQHQLAAPPRRRRARSR